MSDGLLTRLRAHPLLHGAAAVVALAAALPLVWLAIRGAQTEPARWVAVLSDPALPALIGRSVGLAALVGALCGAIALPLAWITHATDVPGRRLLRRLVLLPLAVPSYVSGFVVVALLGPTGWLRTVGFTALPDVQGWLGTTLALLFAYPYALIPVQTSLAQLDARQWEAARSLGASPWTAFRTVVLPHVAPSWFGGMTLVALYVLSDFGAVSLMRFPSLSYVIYVRWSNPFSRGEAVIWAVVLAALALLVLGLASWWTRGSGGGGARPSRPWPVVATPGWLRGVSMGFAGGVVATFAALPIGVVTGWLVRGLMHGATLVDLRAELAWTLGLGAAAALVTTAAALAPAMLLRVGHPRLARLVERVGWSGYALPGIVVALALVFFATRTAPFLYHTLALLIFAYFVRFLPQATTSLAEGLGPGTMRLHEAARSLGATPAAAWRRAVLPVARPAIVAALLAVFLSTIKELPATLLLRPPGVTTLGQRVWSLTQDAFFTAASPTVLLLLLLAFAALLLTPDSRSR